LTAIYIYGNIFSGKSGFYLLALYALLQPNFADPGQHHDADAGLYPAIIVAIIVANTAIMQRSRHSEVGTAKYIPAEEEET
jgi:hypothetical protein